MRHFSDVKALYQMMGPVRFFIFAGGLTAIIFAMAGVHWWLSEQVGWPGAYGFECRGKGCLWREMWHSGRLLRRGSFYELLLFAWLWLIPFTVFMTVAIVSIRRWLENRRNRIRPMKWK